MLATPPHPTHLLRVCLILIPITTADPLQHEAEEALSPPRLIHSLELDIRTIAKEYKVVIRQHHDLSTP